MPKPEPFLMEDDDGNEIELPTRWEVCPECDGNGSSSSHLGAITESDWSEWDPDDRADYFAGKYDRTCDVCRGTGLVTQVDESKLTPEELQRYEGWCRAIRELYASMRRSISDI
jgi:hypothetical protein